MVNFNRRKATAGAAVLLVVAAAVVLWFSASSPQPTTSPCQCPIATSLAVAPASESTKGTASWYNFSIQSAGGGLNLSDLAFQVQTSSGASVTLPNNATMKVTGAAGGTVGTYAILTGVWSSGGSTILSNQQEIILTTPSTTNLSGDQLVILLSGPASGSIWVNIP